MVFNAFLKSQSFCEAFYARYTELKETSLSYENMKQWLDRYGQAVEGEVESQAERFFFPFSKERWIEDMEKVDNFFKTRYAYYENEWDWVNGNRPEATASLVCYPNPAEGSFMVILDCIMGGEAEIELFDVTGRKVSSTSIVLEEGANHFVIDALLPSGLYLVKMGPHCQRVVIK